MIYDKLVEVLRLCQFGECGCGKCYYKELKGDWCTEDNHLEFFDCDDKLKLDAADAIEALQAEVKKYHDAFGRLSKTAAELEERAVELKQMPKRGEWIKRHEFVEDMRFDGFRCSICNWWKGDFETYNYCPKCGAKMEEKC